MQNLYLAGIQLEKRKEFNSIVADLETRNDVYIVALPEKHNIIEMEYTGKNHERVETGNTLEGYDFCYVTFLYGGKLITVQPSNYYPFTDINNPAKWNYIVYDVVGLNQKAQRTYDIKYDGVDSINVNIKEIHTDRKQYIDISNNNYMKVIKEVVNKYGGYREKEVIKSAIIEKGDTWNDDHKVVNVLCTNIESDGYMSGFAVDLVTKSICG